MEVNNSTKDVDKVLSRGIIKDVIPSMDEFRKMLLSGKQMRFYIGADPTSTALHLSHAKNYMFLEEFRRLGHQVIVLFGDFTAKIGDPTGEANARNRLTDEDVQRNVDGWINQIKPLMDFDASDNPPQIVFNSRWLSKLSMNDVIGLTSNFSVQRMLERDMFEKRIKNARPIFLHEFLYPLLQGYDSVELDVDVELCGTDQIFNALIGRTLLKRKRGKEKFVVAVNLMENPITGKLMSKSKGIGVFLDSTPFEMYASIMAQPDEMIDVFSINNTRFSKEKIEELKKIPNPRDAKMIVAHEITKIFHGKVEADSAQKRYIKQVQKKEAPERIPVVSVQSDTVELFSIVRKCVSDESGSWIRRIIQHGGVRIDGNKVVDIDATISVPERGFIIKIGKKKFFRITK